MSNATSKSAVLDTSTIAVPEYGNEASFFIGMRHMKKGVQVMKHILCPVDGSEPAKRAVATAAALAQRLQAKLTLLHITQYVIGRRGVYEVSTPEESEKYLAEAKVIASGEAYKDPALKTLRARDPANAILDFVEQSDVDHIVMGAAGKGALKTFLIGSVSSDILHKAYCPVTIVH